MVIAPQQAEPRNPGPGYWPLVYLLVALGLCLLTDIAARNRDLEHHLIAETSALSVKNGKVFSNTGNFTDYEERFLLDEFPNTDFARSRIYFFGTSNMKWAFTTWDLPPALRDRLGNYGTGAATHETVLRLVRYVGEKGLFASGNKSEVIIGVSFHLGTPETQGQYFPALVRRQGLYEILPDDRLVETPMSPLERWLLTEKARCSGFIGNIGHLAFNGILARFGLSHQPPPNPQRFQQSWREFMGPDWQSNTDRELERFRQTLLLLQSHKVPVKIILLPQASWMDALPFGQYYDQRVRAIAQSTATPLLDWSKTMSDKDFIDSNHLTVAGQTKFRAMMLKEEAARLRQMGST